MVRKEIEEEQRYEKQGENEHEQDGGKDPENQK